MNSSMEGDENRQDEPGTPPRPPYSPVTPVLSHTKLPFSMPSDSIIPPPTPTAPMTATQSQGSVRPTADTVKPPGSDMASHLAPQSIPEPPPAPISESENPDAIALRSAISVLQMQKQQAEREIRALDKMKKAAADDPEGFVKELLQGNLESKEGDIFNPTAPKHDASDRQVKTEEGDDDRMDVDEMGRPPVQHTQRQSQSGELEAGRFGAIPKPQNVVRMPHINWAKYHILGEPLDRLHEEQRKRPSPGEPRRDAPVSPSRAPEHHVAAPYRPFVDKTDPNPKSKGSDKRLHERT